jgi:hypothetical protein
VKLSRKLLLAGAAIALPISTLAISGVASAAKTGVGTVTCNTITGSISFKPGLKTTGPFTQEKSTAKITLAGCTGASGTTPVPKGGKVTQTLSSATSTNSCTSLATGTAESLTVKWKGAAASTTAFSTYTTGSDSSGGEGFILTKGTTTGSYPATGTASASVYSSDSEAEILAACATTKGLTKLTIAQGTSTT